LLLGLIKVTGLLALLIGVFVLLADLPGIFSVMVQIFAVRFFRHG